MPLLIGPIRILPLAALIFFSTGVSATFAQGIGPDEGVSPDGEIAQPLSLTPSQKSALYNAVLQQRGRMSTMRINPTIGATVSRAVALSDLPDQAGIDNAFVLKYAMVEGDVVVVDPIQMRVIDVIHGDTRP
jgi:hypothetical protein